MKAQTSKMSPLWARTAAGYRALLDESMIVGEPNVNPVMLFWESL